MFWVKTCVKISYAQNERASLYIHAAILDSSSLPTSHIDQILQVFLGSIRSPAFIHDIGCGQE